MNYASGIKKYLFMVLIALPMSPLLNAQIVPTEESLSAVYTGSAYSPYAGRTFSEIPLWGDSHLHTELSMDAGMFGNRLGPDDAYQFARGDEITASSGQPVRLSRPLDWLVIADHSDAMGLAPDVVRGAAHLNNFEQSARWMAGVAEGGQAAVEATIDMVTNFANNNIEAELMNMYSPGAKLYKNLWERVVDSAETYNDPGTFTALIGFEWTSLIAGNNMHRVVIMRDGGNRAKQVVPFTMTAPQGSPNPRDLWKYLQAYEDKTNGEILAIAHNGNLSNGIMFPLEAQYDGLDLDAEYVTQRARWEPIYEVTQIKGDGETHPFLSPDDEFADYENWDVGNLDVSVAKTNAMLAGEYAREALKRGLILGQNLGVNPYKFGMIGATDSHTGLATAGEDNFFGKHTGYEPAPGRIEHTMISGVGGSIEGWQLVASGLAAVWAEENTRASIFDAMMRKEVYGTTGSRMRVRVFGGWEFADQDMNSRIPATIGYQKGVPMGADLRPRPSEAGAPNFLVYALKDSIGANLDRIQMVKGWMDDGGETHEQVYNIAWSGDRTLRRDGTLPAVGNTVDVEFANWTNTIGSGELFTVWEDPDFDPDQNAFYYVRVLEIPTPRWSTYDAFRFGTELHPDAPTTTQERAYTSPIWYTPAD